MRSEYFTIRSRHTRRQLTRGENEVPARRDRSAAGYDLLRLFFVVPWCQFAMDIPRAGTSRRHGEVGEGAGEAGLQRN